MDPRLLRVLSETAAQLTEQLDRGRVLEVAAERLVNDFGAVLARGWLCDEKGPPVLRASAGAPGASALLASALARAIDEGHARFDPVDEGHARFDPVDASDPAAGVTAVAILPLVAAGRPCGALGAGFATPLDEERRALLGAFAGLIVTALAGACLADDLEAQRRRFYDLFMEAPAMIVISRGPEHVMELINPAAARALSSRLAVGRSWRESIPEVLGQEVDQAIERVYRTGEPLSMRAFPVRLDRGDGTLEERYFNFVLQPTRDGRGQIDGLISYALEVTDEVRGRQRIEALAMSLAEQVARLKEVEAQLQDAVHARDEFLAIASHELKTPLTSLQLQVQGIQRGLRSGRVGIDRLSARFGVIDRQVDRLCRLVDELLDVSRATAGPLELELEPVDLAELVRQAAGRLDEEATRAGCRLQVAADQPVVGHWDRLRLEHVVGNLVANAIKYGAGGAIELSATAQDGRARLVVRDHGIGVASEDAARIFDRFVRAVSGRHYGGFGLGLWIVRRYVEAMGGEARVESERGAGATFTIELPLAGPPAARA